MNRLILLAILGICWGGLLPFVPARAAQIDRPYILVEKSLFAEVAEKALREELKNSGEDRPYELKVVRLPPAMSCPVGDIQVEAKPSGPLRYDHTIPVAVLVKVDGTLYRRAVCYYAIEVQDTVLVAAHKLDLEQVLTPQDVRREKRVIPGRQEVYLKEPDEVTGKVPTRVIKEGTMLTRRMLQNPIVMESGTLIKIRTKTNGIYVETEGVALQRGRVGKKIRVRNAASAKVLRGTVVDAVTVEV